MEQQTIQEHPMKRIYVEKLTLNVGAGKDQQMLEKGVKLLEAITGIPPVKTVTQKRVPGWGLRPGLPIGCKITLRGKQAQELLPRLLSAKDNRLEERNFDSAGNVSFGIPEYIDIDGVDYDPSIGIIGLQVCLTLARPGYRVKNRRLRPAKVGKDHQIVKEEAIEFMKKEFNTGLAE